MPDISDPLSQKIRTWFNQVWNNRRSDIIDIMLSPESEIHGIAPGAPMTGAEAFRQFHTAFLSIFDGLHIAVEDTVEQGNQVVARCRVTGTYVGDRKPTTPVRPVDFTGMCIARIEDGRITAAWNNFDFLTMQRQIAAPADAAESAAPAEGTAPPPPVLKLWQ